MTARDDAIAAIREHDWQPAYGCRHGITHDYDAACSICRADVGAMLDAIPDAVLTRLAAERLSARLRTITIVHPHTHHEGTRET